MTRSDERIDNPVDTQSDGVDRTVARLLECAGVPSDPAGLVADVNQRAGSDLSFVGVADRGDSGGALYVRWPDGREGVLTRSPTSVERMRQTAEVLAQARAAGMPVPRHDLVIELDEGVVALVQERLPGAPIREPTAAVIDAMTETNESFAGLLAHRQDVPIPAMHIRHGNPDRANHDLLEHHNDRSRRLLAKIREVGATEPNEMTGDDLVHPDYTFGNVLYDDHGRVTGVVDWNWGALRGDRHYALVRMYVDIFWGSLTPGSGSRAALDRLDHVAKELIDPQLLTMYSAHITLDQLDSWIRYNNPNAVDRFLRMGEHLLLTE
jgi:aminoglycoside phosphotransferase (APT) family kinase protein